MSEETIGDNVLCSLLEESFKHSQFGLKVNERRRHLCTNLCYTRTSTRNQCI